MHFPKIFLFFLLASGIKSAQSLACEATKSTKTNVTWPATETRTISQPACINEALEFAYRQCNDGVWEPEPECPRIQPDKLPECPDGFIEFGDLCLVLSEKSNFPPKCPYDHVVPFASYEDAILYENLGPVWMPVKRNLTYGYGVLQWIEQSTLYKRPVRHSYIAPNKIKGLDCLLYYNSSHISLVSCQEQHVGVCAYTKLHKFQDRLCTYFYDNVPADYSSEFDCFYIGNDATNATGNFIHPYQNHIFHSTTSRTCAIGLEKATNGSYVWENKESIKYTYWSKEVSFDSKHVYGAISSNGWILTEKKPSCVVEKSPIFTRTPRLTMNYNSVQERFYINVSDPYYARLLDGTVLLHCCTDSANDELLSCQRPVLVSGVFAEAVFEYKPNYLGVGNYWCEAKAIANFEVVKTEVVFVNPPMQTIISQTYHQNYTRNSNPLTPDGLKELYRDVKAANLRDDYYPKLMRVIDLEEENSMVFLELWFLPN